LKNEDLQPAIMAAQLPASVADQLSSTEPPSQRGQEANGQYVSWITIPMPTEAVVTAHGVGTPRELSRERVHSPWDTGPQGMRHRTSRDNLLPGASRGWKPPPQLACASEQPIRIKQVAARTLHCSWCGFYHPERGSLRRVVVG
jgi:hypothetical protein